MHRLRSSVVRLLNLFRRNRLDSDLREQLETHRVVVLEDLVAQGMDPEDAEIESRKVLGNRMQVRELSADARTFRLLDDLARDVRHAVRSLRRSPLFAAVTLATLALAIGASTAMFSVINAVLFQPLPYPSPEELVMLWSEDPAEDIRDGRSAYASIEQWRIQSEAFADFAFYDPVSLTLTSSDGAEQIGAARTSPNFFPLLGIQAVEGRTFTSREATERQRVAVIGHRFWIARFGGSPDAIGATIELDGTPSRIIGVLPANFRSDRDVWEPHTMFPDWETRLAEGGPRSWMVIGRLRPDATLERAQAEMTAIARRLDEELPAVERGRGISVVPLSLQETGPRTRAVLWMLAGAVICVLLVAATNVASLSLARSAGRRRELAVRAAIGAGRGRIVRQLLAESLTLAAVSGALGLILASAWIRFIQSMGPGNLARLDEVGLDPHALGWTAAVCFLTGILVGLAPAITMTRRNWSPFGLAGGRGITAGVTAGGTRCSLIVSELALAVVLLVGAGLLVRSLWQIQNVALGFRPEGVLSIQLATSNSTTDRQRAGFYDQVLESTAALPGAQAVAIIGDLFVGGSPEQTVSVEGNTRTVSQRIRLRRDEVSEDFFRALGTPLVAGRAFSTEDRPDSPRVAIVNETMARRLWPAGDPVGGRFKLGPADSPGPVYTVVGVVADMRREGIENEPIPQMFEALAQNPSGRATLLVRTSAENPLEMSATVRAAVGRIDRHAPLYGVTTLEDRLAGFLAPRRFQTSLLIGFSAFALLLAAIGVYGLIAYSVAARRREIGIRLALGAGPSGVLTGILREGLRLTAVGLIIGLGGALGLARLIESSLFGIEPNDPATLTVVAATITLVAAAACWLPAWRASRLDPNVVLRDE